MSYLLANEHLLYKLCGCTEYSILVESLKIHIYYNTEN